MAAPQKPPPKIPGDLIRGNGVVGLGDSITAADVQYSTGLIGSRSWLVRACMASGGRMKLVRNSGVSGDTTAMMLARIQTDVIAYRPAACFVLGGINDITTGAGVAVAQTNLTTIFNTLRANKIVPIPCLLCAQNTVVYAVQVEKLNAWIRAYCEKHGWPYVNFPAATVDKTTGVWISGYNADTTHPNTVGTLAMANQAVSDVAAFFPQATTPLETYPTTDWSGVNLLKYGLFSADSNADGIADVWFKGGGATWNTGITPSLVAGSPTIWGNWQRAVWTTLASRYYDQNANAAGWSVGETLRFCGRFSTANSAGGCSINAGLLFNGTAVALYPLYAFSGVDVTNWVWDQEAVIPVGTTTVDVQLILSGAAGQADFGQVTLLNKTRLGML